MGAYNAGPKHFAAVLEGHAELSAETRDYQARVTRLWAQRDRSTLE